MGFWSSIFSPSLEENIEENKNLHKYRSWPRWEDYKNEARAYIAHHFDSGKTGDVSWEDFVGGEGVLELNFEDGNGSGGGYNYYQSVSAVADFLRDNEALMDYHPYQPYGDWVKTPFFCKQTETWLHK